MAEVHYPCCLRSGERQSSDSESVFPLRAATLDEIEARNRITSPGNPNGLSFCASSPVSRAGFAC